MSDAKIQTESGSSLTNSSNEGTIKIKTDTSPFINANLTMSDAKIRNESGSSLTNSSNEGTIKIKTDTSPFINANLTMSDAKIKTESGSTLTNSSNEGTIKIKTDTSPFINANLPMSDAKIQTERGSTLRNSSNEGTLKTKTDTSPLSDYGDEVIILPTPEKPKPPIITLDESPEKGNNNESIAINSEQEGAQATKNINSVLVNKNSQNQASHINENCITQVSSTNKKSGGSKTLNNNNNAVTKKVTSNRILKSKSTNAEAPSVFGSGTHNNLAPLNARNVYYSYHTSNYASYYYNPNAPYSGTFPQVRGGLGGPWPGGPWPGYYRYPGSRFRNPTPNSYNLFRPSQVDFYSGTIANVQNSSPNAIGDTQTSGSANSHEITKNPGPDSNQRIHPNFNLASPNNTPQIVRLSSPSLNYAQPVDPACNSRASPANEAGINTCETESSISENNSSQPINISTNNSGASLVECASGNKGNDLLQIHQNSCPVIDKSNSLTLVTNTKTLENQSYVNMADNSTPSLVKPTNGEKVSVLSEIHQNSASSSSTTLSNISTDKQNYLSIPVAHSLNVTDSANPQVSSSKLDKALKIISGILQQAESSVFKDNDNEKVKENNDSNCSNKVVEMPNSNPPHDLLNSDNLVEKDQCNIVTYVSFLKQCALLLSNSLKRSKNSNKKFPESCGTDILTYFHPVCTEINEELLTNENSFECSQKTNSISLDKGKGNAALNSSLAASERQPGKDSNGESLTNDLFPNVMNQTNTKNKENSQGNSNEIFPATDANAVKVGSLNISAKRRNTSNQRNCKSKKQKSDKEGPSSTSQTTEVQGLNSEVATVSSHHISGQRVNRSGQRTRWDGTPKTNGETPTCGSGLAETTHTDCPATDLIQEIPRASTSKRCSRWDVILSSQLANRTPFMMTSRDVTPTGIRAMEMATPSPDSTADNDIEANLQKDSQHSVLTPVISADSALDIAIEATVKQSILDSLDKELNIAPCNNTNLPETEEGLREELKTMASQEKSLKEEIKPVIRQLNKASILVKSYSAKKRKIITMQSWLLQRRCNINNLLKAFKEKNKTSDLVEFPVPTKRKYAKSAEASTLSEKRMKNDDSLGCSPSASTDVNNVNTVLCDTSEEVIILPILTKPDPPLIVLDEEESTAKVNKEVAESASSVVNNLNAVLSNKSNQITTASRPKVNNQVAKLKDKKISTVTVSSFFNNRSCLVHCGLINQIEVFDEHLYICSRDGTANRTSLKDYSDFIIYRLTETDGLITNITVGKVQNLTVVCALTNKNLVVMLHASSGKRIAAFSEASTAMSLCKGWDNFYSAWSDGTIHIYSWASKEALSKEIHPPQQKVVKTYQSTSSLATTVEGNLPFLLQMTTHGKIIVRGAETAVYIRSIEVNAFVAPIFAIHQNYVYFCSKAKVLSVFNFLTRKAETSLVVNKEIVGIAFNTKYVFTIMAKSNEVNCHNLEKLSEPRRVCKGEAWGHLSSIYVYDDLLLLGNNNGKVFTVKFHIQDSFSCKFGNCNRNFNSRDALLQHLESVHIKSTASRCEWLNCGHLFAKKKMRHVRKHLAARPAFSFV